MGHWQKLGYVCAIVCFSMPLVSQPPHRIRLGRNIAARGLISKVDPVYPPVARQAGIQGTVSLNIVIGQNGHVASAEYVSGDKLLVDAAKHAVMQWVYNPTLVSGQRVEVLTQVDIPVLPREASSDGTSATHRSAETPQRAAPPSAGRTLPADADGKAADQYLLDTILTKCGDFWLYGESGVFLTAKLGLRDLHESLDWSGRRVQGERERLLSGSPGEPGSVVAPTNYVWEFKKLEFRYSGGASEPGSADALNGVTWSGIADVRITGPWRVWERDKGWSEWSGPPWRDPSTREYVVISKKDGQWLFDGVHADKLAVCPQVFLPRPGTSASQGPAFPAAGNGGAGRIHRDRSKRKTCRGTGALSEEGAPTRCGPQGSRGESAGDWRRLVAAHA